MDAVEIGKRIKKYRLAKGLTQKQLADLLYTDSKKVSKWENGHVKMDLELITQICNALDISVHDFLDGIDYKQKFTKITKISKFIWHNISKILFIIAFVLLFIYFLNNYGVVKYYNIKSDSIDLKVENGLFLESKYKNILILNNFMLYNMDYEILNVKVRLYTYVNGEKVYFYENDSLDSIYIEEYYGVENIFTKKIIDGIKRNLYIIIDIIDKDNETHSYETKLDVIYKFSNNKIAYFKNKDLIEEKSLNKINYDIDEMSLIKSDFKKDDLTNTYNKEMNKNLLVNVDLNAAKITIYLKSKNYNSVYHVYYKQKYFKYTSTKKGVTNNYSYHYENDLLECFQGNCDTYKEDTDYVLNLLDKLF